jgi:hypothetical protein
MDLTKQRPRSALELCSGVVMAWRTTDKCRAFHAGTLGSYIYDCPLDKKLFAFLGTDAEEFAQAVREAQSDADIEAFVREKIAGRSDEEIVAWNQDFLRYEPDLSRPSYQDAVRAIRERAPDRTDLTLWVDVVDIEEGRPVPSPEEVRARKETLGLAA